MLASFEREDLQIIYIDEAFKLFSRLILGVSWKVCVNCMAVIIGTKSKLTKANGIK